MTKVKIYIKDFLSSVDLGPVAEAAIPNHNEIIKELFLNNSVDFLTTPHTGDNVVLGDFLDSSLLPEATTNYFLAQADSVFTVKEIVIRKDYLYVIFERRKAANSLW